MVSFRVWQNSENSNCTFVQTCEFREIFRNRYSVKICNHDRLDNENITVKINYNQFKNIICKFTYVLQYWQNTSTVCFHSNLLSILIDTEISAYSFGKALEKLSNILLLRNVLYLEIFF